MAEVLPERTALRASPGAERHDDGRTIVGGAPRRMLRLSPRGAALVEGWIRGQHVGAEPGAQRLARRLLDAGIVDPVFPSAEHDATVTAVVPVRDDTTAVCHLVEHLTNDARVAAVVVVDDGSADPAALAAAVRRAGEGGARILRRDRSGGPAAARNAGWPETVGDLVAFVDADVEVRSGWLEPLIAHFADQTVAAVAPRVTSPTPARDASALERYEATASPLDLGEDAAPVAPTGRLRYLPTAAVVVRRNALVDVGGFDEALRFGEDVDWCWRAHDAGWRLRYEPAAVVEHRPRPSWSTLIDQRRGYGSAAAPLHERHPGRVAPLEVNPWTVAIWAAVGLGRGRTRLLGAALAAASVVPVARSFRGRTAHPWRLAAAATARGHAGGLRWLLHASRRAWLPLLVFAAVVRLPGARRWLTIASVGAVAEWRPDDRGIDPVRHGAFRLVDDAAYCAGVWQGALRGRSPGPLLPRRPR